MSRFRNLDPAHRLRTRAEVFRWAIWDRVTGRRKPAPPGEPAPRLEPDLELVRSAEGPARLTWIGHASFLGTLGGAHFLVDPVFSPRVAGMVERHGEPGLVPSQVPELAAVLVSHNHYDHLDAPSLAALPPSVPVLVPLGLGAWFRRRGHARVQELDWWQAADLGPLRITLVPSRHWSRRVPWDTNRSLWGGFVIEREGGTGEGTERIYHAGDSGLFETFREIGDRFPGLAAAILPVGAYDPGWFMEPNHMNPEQAGEAFLALGARRMVPMHWGSFQLTSESLCEPAERLEAWWKENDPGDGRSLHVMAVGETLVLA